MFESKITSTTGKGFDEILNSLGTKYWGSYLLNKFFIQINTGRNRSSIASYDYENFNFDDEDQIELQKENYPALYHEYIHYIHEVTTMSGISTFNFEIINRATFSQFVDIPQSSSINKIDEENERAIRMLSATISNLFGGAVGEIMGKIILKIEEVTLQIYPTYIPFRPDKMQMKIPVIICETFDPVTQVFGKESVFFAKFFIYEGLAHNLDQLVTVQLGRQAEKKTNVSAEYKVMEMLADFLVPGIPQKDMLTIASLSLSYINCGEYFCDFLERYNAADNKNALLETISHETSMHLATNLDALVEEMNTIVAIFEKRSALHRAVGYIVETMIEGFKHRITDPSFEVRVTYSGRTQELMNYAKLCPMLYQFTDSVETYMRDFAGSYLSPELSDDLLILLCHVDYYQTMVSDQETHTCPLYTCCNQKLRKNASEVCRTLPRLSFEHQSKMGYCHYSLGISYMKGTDIP